MDFVCERKEDAVREMRFRMLFTLVVGLQRNDVCYGQEDYFFKKIHIS